MTALAASSSAPAKRTNEIPLYLGFAGMVLGQFMAILDIQIVASSLPQIQSGIGASADEVSWVQTAYLIPEVVMIPLSAFLSRLWGSRPLFLGSCAGFILMSVITGFSTSIEMMIVTRALQGFLGGAMIPTTFAAAFIAFPPDKRIISGVIMGTIVTLAPTIGPTLGGHLTEWLDWRWLFFINVFPGVIVLALVWRYANFDKGDPSLAKNFDWAGLGLMAVGLMSLQYVLEEGAKENWFADTLILTLAIVAAGTLLTFVMRSLASANPIVDFRPLADRNFAVGVLMTATAGAVLFGSTFLLPLFLGRIRGFSSSEVGTTMLVTGIAMMFTGPGLGRFIRKMDMRVPMVVGFAMCAAGMWMARAPTTEWGFWQFAGVQTLRGAGVMAAMIAAQQATLATLPTHMVKNASGLVNLSRNVGGAIALAVLNSTLSQQTAEHLETMSASFSSASPAAQDLVAGLTQRMEAAGSADPASAAMKIASQMISRDAMTLAFGDAFFLLAIMSAVAAVIAVFAKPPKIRDDAPGDARATVAVESH